MMPQRTGLDPNLPLPLYHQLKNLLLQKIQEGEWRPGFCIPTETELMRTYKVSRTTVREAVSALVHEGYLSKKQGRGTFVNHPRLQERLGRLTGFAEEMLQQGYVPSAELIAVVDDVSNDKTIQAVGLPNPQDWVRIERIRLASGDPIAVERSYWPKDIADLLRQEDLSSVAYYEVLERNGLFLSHAEEDIAAVNANREDAKLLGIPLGAALIEMRRLSYDTRDRFIEYTCTRYRGDRYIYHVRLQR
ncbi:GntR family transcriptional regulator [Alicyclobacillus macrosporangiidus]|uniref:GntR family transcriptional regulator n=1 Tax=Alicyclobacillus macrosporangiidus TaxID=392015 RepID=UPI0018CC35BA|nr:GntR family transcriptional regulator [Alicyclobacillus macrosporangiidus]